MIIFAKLLLAHLLGDFVFQPDRWVAHKNAHKGKSKFLYAHTALHFALAWAVVWDVGFVRYAALLALAHGLIDTVKLYAQNERTERIWFIGDQALHVLSIAAIAILWNGIDLRAYTLDDRAWIYAAAVLLLTSPASILIKKVISIWTPDQTPNADVATSQTTDLQNAGKYIGILERLFVFFFIMTGNFASIGFLMAAKSIFRFGDLTKSNDRKLTEYVLIGTLLSFGVAIATGFAVKSIIPLL